MPLRPVFSTAIALLLLRLVAGCAGPSAGPLPPPAPPDAVTHYQYGRLEESERLARKAVAQASERYGPTHPAVAAELNKLGIACRALGHFDEAENAYRRALTILEQAPGVSFQHMAATLNNLAELLRLTGRYAEARQAYRVALSIFETNAGPRAPAVAGVLRNIASLHREEGDLDQAERAARRALDIQEEVFGRKHPEVAETLRKLAEVHRARGGYSEANLLLHRALVIEEEIHGEGAPETASTLSQIALCFLAEQRLTEAERMARAAIDARQRMDPPHAVELANDWVILAWVHMAGDHPSQAHELLVRALRVKQQAMGKTHPSLAPLLHDLARTARELGNIAEAEGHLQQAVLVLEQNGDEGANLLDTLAQLAEAYFLQQKHADALVALRKQYELQVALTGKDHPSLAPILTNLGLVHTALGQYDDAAEAFLRAKPIYEQGLGELSEPVAEICDHLAAVEYARKDYEAQATYQAQAKRIRDALAPPVQPTP